MQMPTQQDFATEVRLDRLNTLWRATLIGTGLAAWAIVSVAMMQRADISLWIGVLLLVAAGSLATRFFVQQNRFEAGVWSYASGALAAIALALAGGDPVILEIVPFFFPLLIFVIGLLIPPSNTIFMAIAATAIIVLAPLPARESLNFIGPHQIAAVVLTFLAVLLAGQVIGELYQVTQWSLENYQRERRTSAELFENREALERTLRRSEALSERLRETNDELEHARAQAEEAKHFRGQFLANMSHELRTPLNAIIGFSETMLRFPAMYDGVVLPNAYEADLQQIYTSGKQLLGLINDILDLSKVDAGKLEVHLDRMDLRPVINGVLSTASGLISNRPIKLEAHIPDVLPPVYADDARVRQVLLNLYSNAAKFTDKGVISLTVRELDDALEISVRDTGGGIAQHNLELIFEEFKQAETGRRDPRSGAGLGLAISRQLLGLMGGRIWAESELGKGSTFTFVLPRYDAERIEQAQPEPEPAPAEINPYQVIREKTGV